MQSRHLAGPRLRLAGALYLVIIIAGITAEVAVRGTILVPGDAAATADAIRASGGLFRAGLLLDITMALADVALAGLLYLALRAFGDTLSLLALLFRLTQAALIGASVILLSTVPDVAASGGDALAHALTRMHATGYDIGLAFFGVCTLLTATLLRRTQVPALIAWALAGAGVVYLAGTALRVAAPDLHPLIQPAYLLPLLAETAFCLWLLIRARL